MPTFIKHIKKHRLVSGALVFSTLALAWFVQGLIEEAFFGLIYGWIRQQFASLSVSDIALLVGFLRYAFALLVAFAIVCGVFLAGRYSGAGARIRVKHPAAVQGRQVVDPTLSIVLGAAILVISLAVGFALIWNGVRTYQEGWPIKWVWGSFLNMSTFQIPGPLQIWGIEGEARNISDGEVEFKDGYIASGRTGKRVALKFNDGYGKLLDPHQLNPVPTGASVHVVAHFVASDHALTEEQFWAEWGPINLVVRYDGREFHRIFSLDELKAEIDHYRPPPGPPRVSRRTERNRSLQHVMRYIAKRSWPEIGDNQIGGRIDQLRELANQIRQQAIDGNITIWGRTFSNPIFVPTDRSHWINNDIDISTYLMKTDMLADALRATINDKPQSQGFVELMFNQDEVERVWRRLNDRTESDK